MVGVSEQKKKKPIVCKRTYVYTTVGIVAACPDHLRARRAMNITVPWYDDDKRTILLLLYIRAGGVDMCRPLARTVIGFVAHGNTVRQRRALVPRRSAGTVLFFGSVLYPPRSNRPLTVHTLSLPSPDCSLCHLLLFHFTDGRPTTHTPLYFFAEPPPQLPAVASVLRA